MTFSDLFEYFILFFILAFLGLIVKLLLRKSIESVQEEQEKLGDLYVEFVRMEEQKVYFTCHELSAMYYVVLDAYDYENTKVEEKYHLKFIPKGWGRHKIVHNNKTYSLYEI